ncbi:hypothetical protein JMJ35_004123 [Cladonia borealis]|uniref:Uncharacterized protein n=1 Tax=Cladonia borealis TaxID=184061 RepID=A0AA39R1F3_9LECA|nr:hypothetical protein JMJ35_004123 [Cladonia borealis]
MLLKYDPGEEDEDYEMEELEESEEDDEDDDADALDDIQCSLFEVLQDIEEVKTWASYGPIKYRLPITGLHLSRGGVVGLPLSSMDASRIKQHASQFGSKSNPSVDDNDLTCDLDSSQFELRNPAWHTAARMLALEATRTFAVGDATIQLRGLTLSGPSRPLTLWQDPNPDPAAFGSLMIILPSLHRGGDIKLTYGNETKQFSTDIASEFGHSFVAWFSDVRLELDPILSGYRLHVIYDLHSPLTQLGVNLSAFAISEEANAYQSMLEQWSRLREDVGNSNPLVAYILEDKEQDYKHGPLSYGRLNENHRQKAKYLKQQCLESKVCFWLARMFSSVDSRGYAESIFELGNISELDGTEVLEGNVYIDKEDVVEIGSFNCREENDSDYGERSSEYDDGLYHFKDWVFLLLPESQRMQFLAEHMSTRELRLWIACRTNSLHSSGSQSEGASHETSMEEQRKELAFMCQHVMSMERSKRRDHDDSWLPGPDDPAFSLVSESLVVATLVARQVSLFGSAVRKCPGKLSQAMWREIGKEFNDDDVLHGEYKDRLAVALSRIPTLTARYVILKSILSGYIGRTVKPDDDPLRLWARENIVSALSSLGHATEEDVKTLAAIEQQYGKDILKEGKVSDK